MHGQFVWYELMTTDMKGAEKFYKSVSPWTAKDASMPNMAYTLFSLGESTVAGMMPMLDDVKKRGVPPNWTGYVAVDNVDASTALAKKEGGSVLREPTDIPNVGRFSVIADPLGAAIALFHPSGTGMPSPPAPDAPGMISWRELHSTNYEKVLPFYQKLFKWDAIETMDMGPMGKYQIYGQGQNRLGGMFNSPSATKFTFWHYYINVKGVEAAAEVVKNSGGRVLMGPMQVPGGNWVIQCTDPQGAHIALVGAK